MLETEEGSTTCRLLGSGELITQESTESLLPEPSKLKLSSRQSTRSLRLSCVLAAVNDGLSEVMP